MQRVLEDGLQKQGYHVGWTGQVLRGTPQSFPQRGTSEKNHERDGRMLYGSFGGQFRGF